MACMSSGERDASMFCRAWFVPLGWVGFLCSCVQKMRMEQKSVWIRFFGFQAGFIKNQQVLQ